MMSTIIARATAPLSTAADPTDLTGASLTRRVFLAGAVSSVSLAALTLAAPIALAQAQREEIPEAELMAEGTLPDIVYGSPDAKVTVVEYASMTCGHCANFHTTIFPELKKKYVDTGKVKFVVREFPLDNLAAAASMLTRCTNTKEKQAALTDALYKRRSEWVIRGNPVPRLFDIAKQVGFTEKTFNACLQDQELLRKIAAVRERGSEKFGVNATPTFFINGKRFRGGSVEAFAEVIDPLLKSS
ncbi:MAG: DsbA family protein [Pseudomonadota bacterium]